MSWLSTKTHYPQSLIIVSLTTAIFLVGLCGLLALQAKRILDQVTSKFEVSVYLKKNIRSSEQDSIYHALIKKPYVYSNGDHETGIEFISKETAEQKYIDLTNENFKSVLPESPLLDCFSVRIKKNYLSNSALNRIVDDIQAMSGVEEVTYLAENWASTIQKKLTDVYWLLISFVVILFVIVAILINGTIRLALYSQRKLIKNMQLVGASSSFIQKPYLQKSFVQGLVSGVFASLMVVAVHYWAIFQVEELKLIADSTSIFILTGFLVVLSLLISLICSYWTVNRYLHLNTDDVY